MSGSKSKLISSLFRTVTSTSSKNSDSKAKTADITLKKLIPLFDSSHTSTSTSGTTGKSSNKSPKVSTKAKSRSKKPPPITARESYAVKWTPEDSESKLLQSLSSILEDPEEKNTFQSISSMLGGKEYGYAIETETFHVINSAAHILDGQTGFTISASHVARKPLLTMKWCLERKKVEFHIAMYYFHCQDQVLHIPWLSTRSPNCVSQHRKELTRSRKQKWIFKNSQVRHFDQLVVACEDKLGAEDTLKVFGKLGRETGVKEYNTLIRLCINKARTSQDEDVSLDHIHKAFEIFKSMRDKGLKLEEETYGPLLTYLVDMGMVEDLQFVSKIIKDNNPDTFSRLSYYEMKLWIKVDNKDKVQELCNSIGVDNDAGRFDLAESYLLALCESDRNEELMKLLDVIDVTKVSSVDYLSNIFKSLGRRKLENFAEKFILALKASEAGAKNLSDFIFSYATGMPDLAVEDAILEFKKLHKKFHVPPASTSYEKLVRHCCDVLEVHEALDIVDQMCQLGFSLSIEILHPILDAVEESCELDLVRPIYSVICHHNLKPSSETFRRMINLCVRMKDFEGAYNMLTDLTEMDMKPTTHMYNSIMAGYFREKNIRGGLMVLDQMKRVKVDPDSQTFSYLIGNCEHEEDIVKYCEELQSTGVQATKQVYMAMINAYVNCGQFQKAKQVVLEQGIPGKYITEVKSALVSALAYRGQISDALKIYEEIKQARSRLEPKAIISLIENLQSEGELNRLIDLLGELTDPDFWFDGCGRVVSYCVRYNHLSSAVDLLKQLKGKDELSTYAVIDQVFAQIPEAEPTALEIGLDLLRAIKEEVGLRPSRTSLDFLLAACVSAKDGPHAWLIWEEYQKAGLLYNVLSFLRMHQVLLAAGECKAANNMLKKIAKDDPHVRRIIKESQVTFGKSVSVKAKRR
ncbi:Pentatricopeptide repeat [Macleaya cordata]|uniref:Pentatricopeptide repeat n=1 Tax=Macleaya cordata TaxID=56857 RepID=A0A200QKW5_MACCD|nr:Pentatricopeptide repeat [Macleaya cordata]